tara:strand:- start:115 stop:417 length:303 start_codon:yes stop_codon:yes gene_type:complete
MGDEPPKPKRHLTQKYNMKAIHALTNMEEEFLSEVGKLYGCDPDDLTVNIDLLEIYNEKADNRAEHMRSLLSGCPQDASELIAKTVAKMVELDAETKSDV